MDKDKCKTCGYEIIMGGRYPDQVAQSEGYCGQGCQEVDAAIKAEEMSQAAKP